MIGRRCQIDLLFIHAGDRRLPPHDEEQFRQLPRELHSGAMKCVKVKEIPVVVQEPTLDAPDFFGSEVTHDLGSLKERCGAIITNLWSDDLADVAGKVYTRDPFRPERVFHVVLFQSPAASAAGDLSSLLRIFLLIPFGVGMRSDVPAFCESAAAPFAAGF